MALGVVRWSFKKHSKTARAASIEEGIEDPAAGSRLAYWRLAFLFAGRLRLFLRNVRHLLSTCGTIHDPWMSRRHAAGELDCIGITEGFPARGTDVARDERSPPCLWNLQLRLDSRLGF
jgi:hypothetical protein